MKKASVNLHTKEQKYCGICREGELKEEPAYIRTKVLWYMQGRSNIRVN